MPFVPDDPPKADLISISPPTADGEVTLTGAADNASLPIARWTLLLWIPDTLPPPKPRPGGVSRRPCLPRRARRSSSKLIRSAQTMAELLILQPSAERETCAGTSASPRHNSTDRGPSRCRHSDWWRRTYRLGTALSHLDLPRFCQHPHPHARRSPTGPRHGPGGVSGLTGR